MSRATIASALAAALLLGGCSWTARRRADDRLAGGDARTAAAEYRRLLDQPLSLEPKDRLLFRAATAQALVDLEGDDTSESRALLERLVAEYPDSPYRASAEVVLRLLDRDAGSERGGTAAEKARSELETLRANERARRARIAELEARLEELRRENEMLKAIDLDRPPEVSPP